jgi:hypothetical protein
MRWLGFVLTCVLTGGAAVFVAVQFGDWRVQRLEKQVDRLEQEKAGLRDYARRLSASRRVAQVNVLEQKADENGRIVTSVRWQEIGPDGLVGPPLLRTVHGRQIYFESLVIKFDSDLVGVGDPERGESLALFRRIFGDGEAAESVPEFGREARPPTASQPARQNDAALWERFWALADDPKLARDYGIRIAQIEAPALVVAAGDMLEITLDASGGLNARKLAPTP